MIGSAVSHYEVLERLGGGGMGVVYKAWDPRLERYVALKFLSESRGEHDDHQRFIREARTASVLDHPNICTVYEIGEVEDGRLFIAMAFCEGESLKAKLDRGPLPLAQAVDLAAQVAAGLAEAHGKKIVHRDIKPGNIMISPDGRAKIVDFGIAWLAGETRLTQTGAVIGTTAYLAPEHFRREGTGPAADLWSLGVVLYEMVTGALPFPDQTESDLIKAILRARPAPMAELRRGVPALLDRIVARTLARRPGERHASAAALRSELVAAGEELAAAGPDAEETVRESPHSSRGPGLAVAASSGSGDAEQPKQPALIGRTIGHYRILAHVGGGGMGIVYRAEDLKLARSVALKFLPFELTRDPESKARFLQEAHTASAIDHPNICTIHEIGESDEGQLYLAMACYDGETLKRRLSRGPLAVDEAVDIAQQIARGLGKAHRKGVIHRDIKPANLMITSDAVVKILDFGIAKLAGSAALTRAGASIGSPGYMSPEQARGEEVDSRTDLWALGTVCYEMLAGRRPFRGEHDQSVLYALFHDTPEPLSKLRTDVPPELERIVDRLLAKDKEQRYGSAADLLADLRATAGQATGSITSQTTAHMDAVTASRLPSAGVRPRGRSLSRRPAALAAALAVAVAVALIAWGFFAWRSRALTPGAAAPVQASYRRLTFQEGSETYPSLSPDGTKVVYAKSVGGKSDLFLQETTTDQPVNQPLNLTADWKESSSQPAFSPDGRQIAFRSERDGGGLFTLALADRSVRRLADFGYNPAWSPDGREIACATEGVVAPTQRNTTSHLWRLDVSTGDRKPIDSEDAVQPSWSPHGRRIAYWGVPAGSSARVVSTLPADGGVAVRAIEDRYSNWDPVWSPDGQYLYYSSDRSGSMNLWRVPIEETTGKVVGEPEPIPTPSSSSSFLSIAANGSRIVFATDEGRSHLESFSLDPATLELGGPVHEVVGGARAVRSVEASPDGKWVVFDTYAPEHLFIVHPDGTDLRQITSGAYKHRIPSWSADGAKIIFYSNRSDRWQAWTVRPDGTELVQLTRSRWASVTLPRWSPDGRWLSCNVQGSSGALIDLAKPLAQRAPQPLPPVSLAAGLFAPIGWSPDGKWLAGVFERTDGTGLPGIVIHALGSHSYHRLTERGELPAWLHDGRRIVFVDEGKIFCVDIESRKVRKLADPPHHSSFKRASAAPDDRRLYVVRATNEGAIWMLDLK